MCSLDEDEFNKKLKIIFNKLILSNKNVDENKYSNIDSNCEYYVHFSEPDDSVNFSLANLRLLLLVNFLSKLTGKSVVVNVGLNSQNSDFKTKLNEIFQIYNFNGLKLNYIEKTNTRANIKDKLNTSLEPIYKLDELDNDGVISINFPAISNELNFINYDKSLKLFNANDLSDSFFSYENFIQNKSSSSFLFILCLNSEYLQRQKVDLLARIININSNSNISKNKRLKYICTGNVKTHSDTKLMNDSLHNYQSREKYFRFAAEQRQKISNESIYEENIKNLTLFSIVYDLLNTKHQNDVNKFKVVDTAQLNTELNDFDDLDQELKLSEQSSFILYNCARLNAIIEKYDSNIKNGIFKQEDMPSINDINYVIQLNSDFERKLCYDFLFKYESIFDELHESLNLDNASSEKSLQIKLNTTKLIKFLVDLSNLVSKYYSKIHILEDPKFQHLHEKMTARIYLIRSIYNLIKYIINLLGVDAIKRI